MKTNGSTNGAQLSIKVYFNIMSGKEYKTGLITKVSNKCKNKVK